MSLTNKVLATTQPDYLHNLIFSSAAALTLLFISCHLSSLLDRRRVPRYHHEPFYSSCIFPSLYQLPVSLYQPHPNHSSDTLHHTRCHHPSNPYVCAYRRLRCRKIFSRPSVCLSVTPKRLNKPVASKYLHYLIATLFFELPVNGVQKFRLGYLHRGH